MSVAPIGQPGPHVFGAHLEKATTLVNDLRDRGRYDEAQVHATIAVALAVNALAQEVRGLRYHADNSDIVEAIDRLSRVRWS